MARKVPGYDSPEMASSDQSAKLSALVEDFLAKVEKLGVDPIKMRKILEEVIQDFGPGVTGDQLARSAVKKYFGDDFLL